MSRLPNSVLGVKSDIGATTGSGTAEHGTFTIPGSTKGTASGSFLGANHGASDKSVAETTMTPSAIISSCVKSGLSSSDDPAGGGQGCGFPQLAAR